ncbi:hypothetical protein [Streptosporangium sp. NPDC020145]|uniref:hypothetical protein n=1 Tax=Streptosporangium sp. NPDC020145 TaxID=3154694 RepID=UPI0034432791
MRARGRDRFRELMVRCNPVPPHEARRRMGDGQEEVLRRIMSESTPRRARGRGSVLVVALLATAVAVAVLPRVVQRGQPGDRQGAGEGPPPGAAASRTGPPITADLARIVHLSAVEPLRGHPLPMSSFPRASAGLLGLARLAGSRPGRQEGPWSYVETEEWLLATSVTRDGTTSRMTPWVVSRWTPQDDQGTYHRTRRPGRPFGSGGWAGITPGADQATATEGGDNTETGAAADLGPRAAALSRSEEELRDQLLDGEPQAGMTRTHRLVRAVEDLHSHDVVEPDLRAALWRTLAAQDDLRDIGQVRDRNGRPGRAFGFEDGPLLGVFVVSSATGGLLATELIRLTGPGEPRPAVEEYRTYLTARWVAGPGLTS